MNIYNNNDLKNLEVVYVDMMRKLWSFPLNDQRPYVLSWFADNNIRGKNILDVGAGDAYYIDNICPSRYDCIEPNYILRQQIAKKLMHHKIPMSFIDSIYNLTKDDVNNYDLILLLHAMFYLQMEELIHLLNTIKSVNIMIVHPDVNNSISCLFEKYLGINTSIEKVKYKEEVLGKPNKAQLCKSHFNLPLNIKMDEIAFLISHHLLYQHEIESNTILKAANQYVAIHHAGWKRSGYYQIPQYQLIEVYN